MRVLRTQPRPLCVGVKGFIKETTLSIEIERDCEPSFLVPHIPSFSHYLRFGTANINRLQSIVYTSEAGTQTKPVILCLFAVH